MPVFCADHTHISTPTHPALSGDRKQPPDADGMWRLTEHKLLHPSDIRFLSGFGAFVEFCLRGCRAA